MTPTRTGDAATGDVVQRPASERYQRWAQTRHYRPSMTDEELAIVLATLSDRLKFYGRMEARGRLRPGTKAWQTYQVAERLYNAWGDMQAGQARGSVAHRRSEGA